VSMSGPEEEGLVQGVVDGEPRRQELKDPSHPYRCHVELATGNVTGADTQWMLFMTLISIAVWAIGWTCEWGCISLRLCREFPSYRR